MKTATFDDSVITSGVTRRLMDYARISTPSDRTAHNRTPSSDCQWDLARALETELKGIGLSAVEVTDHCYVLATLSASKGYEKSPTIAFMTHLDTVADVCAVNVSPRLIDSYDGKMITLKDGVVLDPRKDEALACHKGRAIIISDGATLLGADDKAGIAAAVTAAEYLVTHSAIPHGPVEFLFTPDEEIGGQLSCFPRDKIAAAVAYTIDCEGGENLEKECFNAYAATVTFRGTVIHPGRARGILVNAALMAAAYACMLPRNESPEATDGYYGYYCLTHFSGSQEKASLDILLRDFSKTEMERRLHSLSVWAKAVEAQFPGGEVTVESRRSYRNMRSVIEKKPTAFRTLLRAAKRVGVAYKINPIRGGTDGAALAEMGIPAPNIFTGGYNAHSRIEWASVDEMALAAKVVIETARLWAGA